MRQPQSSVLPISPPGEAHDPPPPRPNVTERVAGWSARHRKTAVFGWLLLVAAIFMAGQALGAQEPAGVHARARPGRPSGCCSRSRPGSYNASTENVLIQATAPGATFATDPAMRQAAAQVAASLAALPTYATASDPFRRCRRWCRRTGAAPWSRSRCPATSANVDQAATTLQHAVAGVQAKHPDLRVAETGDASIEQAIDSSLNFSKAEATSVPITLILLLARVRRAGRGRHPGAARADRADRRHRGADDRQPLAAGRQLHLRGRGDRRHGRRRRLLAVLPAPRARGAGTRPVVPRRAPGRRAHVGPHDPGVRPDRDGHHVRPVLRRRRPVQRHRARHDRRGRHRGDRLADRAARAAGLARAEGGRRPDPVPRPQAGRRPAVPALGGAGPPGRRQAA